MWPFPLWNTTIYGFPRFRLVLLSSRFQIAGGLEINFHDDHGNLRTARPAEVFFPRYHVGPNYWGTYALEMWRPAAWYYEHGFASPTRAREYTPAGNSVRNLEPVWVDGGWEAIWNGPEMPLVFTRNVSTDLIEWAIWAVHLKFRMDLAYKPKPPTRMERYHEQHGKIKKQFLNTIKERQEEFPGLTVNVPAAIN